MREAEELRLKAIAILLEERREINTQLALLSYDGTEAGNLVEMAASTPKRRGRPPKEKAADESAAELQEMVNAAIP